MKCKYEGTGAWAGRCKGTKEVDPCPGYDKCKNFKPDYKTNADHIRGMSDEELADFLAYFNERICEHCACEGRCTSKCIRGVREWLKQPYKEDA